ncbi:hypothetical protein BS47DRAFT_1357448 [Hydnum rufescens UP504]|uniref:Uncharacterized protein n=1 Tax=Hydnum rufescens UP504 TaxID=1448309 RepID=A0A9P6E296_9AGAM|nr:hypothetical protein BS47DRAFT_1357448 [Hydnum rufescens UP504]
MDARILSAPVLHVPDRTTFTVPNAGDRAIVYSFSAETPERRYPLLGFLPLRYQGRRSVQPAHREPNHPKAWRRDHVSASFFPFNDLRQTVLDDVAFPQEHLVSAESKISGYNLAAAETPVPRCIWTEHRVVHETLQYSKTCEAVTKNDRDSVQNDSESDPGESMPKVTGICPGCWGIYLQLVAIPG